MLTATSSKILWVAVRVMAISLVTGTALVLSHTRSEILVARPAVLPIESRFSFLGEGHHGGVQAVTEQVSFPAQASLVTSSMMRHKKWITGVAIASAALLLGGWGMRQGLLGIFSVAAVSFVVMGSWIWGLLCALLVWGILKVRRLFPQWDKKFVTGMSWIMAHGRYKLYGALFVLLMAYVDTHEFSQVVLGGVGLWLLYLWIKPRI